MNIHLKKDKLFIKLIEYICKKLYNNSNYLNAIKSTDSKIDNILSSLSEVGRYNDYESNPIKKELDKYYPVLMDNYYDNLQKLFSNHLEYSYILIILTIFTGIEYDTSILQRIKSKSKSKFRLYNTISYRKEKALVNKNGKVYPFINGQLRSNSRHKNTDTWVKYINQKKLT